MDKEERGRKRARKREREREREKQSVRKREKMPESASRNKPHKKNPDRRQILGAEKRRDVHSASVSLVSPVRRTETPPPSADTAGG